jgi:AcrR family transcriptional regulator
MGVSEIPAELGKKVLAAAESYGTSFDDVSMEEIASVTGVPRATLYYHFRSKEQVLAYLLTAMLDDIATSVEAAAAATGDARTRLVDVVRAQLEAMAARPATSQLLVANLGRAGKLPDIAAGIDRAFQAPVRQILTEGVAAGEIRTVDPEPTATAIFGAVTVVGLHALMLHGHLDVDESLNALVVLWGGLGPAATTD